MHITSIDNLYDIFIVKYEVLENFLTSWNLLMFSLRINRPTQSTKTPISVTC